MGRIRKVLVLKDFDFHSYNTYIFDCDGVLLDSNPVKANAFYEIARKYDEDAAKKFVKFHEENGGISRFEKFKLLHTKFLKASKLDYVERDLFDFAEFMANGLDLCEVCDGVVELLEKLKGKNIFVSSGGAQNEVRSILQNKNLAQYFQEIYGSPVTKVEHVQKIKKGLDLGKTVFIGDAITDLKVSEHYKFDFVFVKKYSSYPELPMPHSLTTKVIDSLTEL